jgi:hypothetical protein
MEAYDLLSGNRNGCFSILRLLKPMINGRFCQPQISAYHFGD